MKSLMLRGGGKLEWSQSAHANFRKDEPPGVDNGPAVNTGSGCVNCHNGKYALQVMSGNAPTNYVEKNAPISSTFPTTCVVCHDPHLSPQAPCPEAHCTGRL